MQLFLLFIFCLSLFTYCILSFTFGISPFKPTSPVLLILCSASVLLFALFLFLLHRTKATKKTLDLIGKGAIVQTELNPKGAIIVNGDLWLAMANDNETISVGSKVMVVNIKGHLLQVDSIAID